MSHPENESKLFLSCPVCAAVLGLGETDTTLICSNKHTFTVETLLLGQSAQANILFFSGIELLEQQIKLIRGIALEHSITNPKAFLQLEVHADKLDKIVSGIRAALKLANQ